MRSREFLNVLARSNAMRALACVTFIGCGAAPHANVRNVATGSESMLTLAGAESCKVDDAVVLGPWGGDDVYFAFDESVGLAAWRHEAPDVSTGYQVSLQMLARDGTKVGTPTTLPANVKTSVMRVSLAKDGFAVVIRQMSKSGASVEWAELVDRSGRVVASHVPAPPESRPSPSELEIEIVDDAEGEPLPPPTEDGVIAEILVRPMLRRSFRGRPVGKPVPLTYRHTVISESNNSFFTRTVWTGTHILYPFWRGSDTDGSDDEVNWYLLPIDCRS